MKASSRDRLGSILILVFVASLWVQRNYMTPFGGIFPDIIMEILAGIGLVTLALSFTPYAAMKEEAEKKQEKTHWNDMIIVGGIVLVWSVFLRFLGFIAAGVLCFTAISWFLAGLPRSVRGFVPSLLVAVGITLTLVLIFQWGLQVPLPAGRFFG